ncbi:MAG TPA: glycosyltransferase [Bryobacteraceae bacterium]|nr:glycosyltransferase [Bryobacteraceae bacterium]
MKIAWFTPLSKKSAIARASAGIVTELAKLADVNLIHFENGDVRDASVPVKRFASAAAVDERTLNHYDLAIYNFGNHLPFHREIFLVSRRHPGICILHDFVMHHFFAAYYFEDQRNPAAYSLLMERLYGEEGTAAAQRVLSGRGPRLWETDEVVRFPLFEEVIRGAAGVVAHSGFLKKHVEACFAGPVRRISLPYDADRSAPHLSRGDLGLEDHQVLIVTVGHVNPNKRIEAVIDALGRLGPATGRVVYAILGPCSPEYQEALNAAVRRNHLERVVRFLGQVPDDVLHAYLSHAGICINLRYPVTEGASASVIEEMLFGKPVIVTDTGFYSELMDGSVIKIHPERESELHIDLARLLEDQALRENVGAAARFYAESEFRADRYAREILDFAWEVRRASPLLGLADRVAVECNRMGMAASMKTVEAVAHEMSALFTGEALGRDTHRTRR